MNHYLIKTNHVLRARAFLRAPETITAELLNSYLATRNMTAHRAPEHLPTLCRKFGVSIRTTEINASPHAIIYSNDAAE